MTTEFKSNDLAEPCDHERDNSAKYTKICKICHGAFETNYEEQPVCNICILKNWFKNGIYEVEE